jgi:hypothetical protein
VGDNTTNYNHDDVARMLKFGKDRSKPIIFIDAGIHAREWIASAATVELIHRLYFYSILKTKVSSMQRTCVTFD